MLRRMRGRCSRGPLRERVADECGDVPSRDKVLNHESQRPSWQYAIQSSGAPSSNGVYGTLAGHTPVL